MLTSSSPHQCVYLMVEIIVSKGYLLLFQVSSYLLGIISSTMFVVSLYHMSDVNIKG